MGLSLSSLLLAWEEIVTPKLFCLSSTSTIGTVFRRSITFEGDNAEMVLKTISFEGEETECLKKSDGSESKRLERSVSFKNWESEEANHETSESLDSLGICKENVSSTCLKCKCKPHVPIQITTKPTILLPERAMHFSPRPASELDAAATKVQKFYKSYRTRRNLADCAIVVEELWWKALDFALLKRSSETFFVDEKPESALSRWTRARTRVAKVGKGLSKDENAQKLALQHWLEAIDPRHRYGHNLHFYYDMWSDSKSTQPFFYWLDVGDGKEVYIESCPRIDLQRQCIKYLGPNEREAYEVIVENGKLVYKQKGILVNTIENSKWIFVLSTSRALYVGQKKKGMFQHSSFLSGAATTAAGRLVVNNGVLKAIWPYSGHYLPTEENFKEFICFLEENHIDLTNVKRCAVDDDMASSIVPNKESKQPDVLDGLSTTALLNRTDAHGNKSNNKASNAADVEAQVMAFNLGKPLSCKWNSGVGPRIGCLRDYPPQLQTQAFEQVNLSPKLTPSSIAGRRVPIPSPRPSPKVRLSPRLAYMGLPSSRAITNL